jgi:hypothetical protein
MDDVAAVAGGAAGIWSERELPPTLEPGRVVVPGGTARTTAYYWGRWVVVTR